MTFETKRAAAIVLLAAAVLSSGCGGALRRVGLGGSATASVPPVAATAAKESKDAKTAARERRKQEKKATALARREVREKTATAARATKDRGAKTASRAPKETGLDKDLRETREAAALAPAEPYWPFHVAELYVGADSLAAASTAIADALARDPDYAPALTLRSRLDARAGRHVEAIRSIEAALARPGAFPSGAPRELIEGLALHYEALGKDDRAQALLAGAPPRQGPPSPALVALTLDGAKPESAAPLAEAAVKSDPRSAVNQNNWGITLLRNGDPLAAKRAFEWATRADPTLAGPWYNLAILHKYYLFDDSTATASFAEYWQRSHRDPDGLAALFGRTPQKPLAQDE